MATAALIGGGLLLGGVASGIGASAQADAQVDAAEIQAAQAGASLDDSLAAQAAAQLQQQQFIEQGVAQGRTDLQGGLSQFEQTLNPFAQTAQTAQQAQLGLLGQGGDPNAAQNLLSSPLVQAINAQNQQQINARAAASGVSGGNVLTSLQDANTATILSAGLGGLQSLSAQTSPFVGQLAQGQLGTGSALANAALGGGSQLGSGALQTGMQGAQNILSQGNLIGQANAAGAIAQGNQNAIPWLSGANIINQGTQLAGFGLGGGFGAGTQTAMQNFGNPFASAPAPSVGGGTLQGMQPVNNFGVL